MKVVNEKTIVLKHNTSQHSIWSALNQDVSTYPMLIDILMRISASRRGAGTFTGGTSGEEFDIRKGSRCGFSYKTGNGGVDNNSLTR